MSAFVDTSAFFATLDRDDRHSARVAERLASEESLIATDHVLFETWRLTRDRLGQGVADRFWAALRIGESFPDQSFSIVDRTSFTVMERLGVHRAISLDDDFAVYRFGGRRERAFEILR